MTGYVAWTCNGCRDMHYMTEPTPRTAPDTR